MPASGDYDIILRLFRPPPLTAHILQAGSPAVVQTAAGLFPIVPDISVVITWFLPSYKNDLNVLCHKWMICGLCKSECGVYLLLSTDMFIQNSKQARATGANLEPLKNSQIFSHRESALLLYRENLD